MNLAKKSPHDAKELICRKPPESRQELLVKGKEWCSQKVEIDISSEAFEGLLAALGGDAGDFLCKLKKVAHGPTSGNRPATGITHAKVVSTMVANTGRSRGYNDKGETFAKVPEKRRRCEFGASPLLCSVLVRL